MSMNALQKSWLILRTLGPGFAWQRVRIKLDHLRGRDRKLFYHRPWESIGLQDICRPGTPIDADGYAAFKRQQTLPYLFPPGKPPRVPEYFNNYNKTRMPAMAKRLKLASEDRCVYFFNQPSPEPIDWYHNPLDDKHSDSDRDWFNLPDFDPRQGDVRTLWEPARAAWAIDTAKAMARGVDVDAALIFWRWVDSWMQTCPPYRGVHWKCGQEATVRFAAIVLGFWAVADDPATGVERWRQLARLAWATGHRIYHHIHYAISQKNNHAISEACGLLLISQLFPEFRESEQWQARGRSVLADQIRRQCYTDGSYIQHSMNYQRVMLQGALLAFRLAELAGRPFERELYDRLGRGGQFLYQMMNPENGRLPNYGNNDGAWMLPLNECDFTDYRGVIQSIHYLCHHKRLLEPGPWDEDLLWLFGPESLPGKAEPQPLRSSAFDGGGYYTLRQEQSWAMIRCHTYRDRPGQCDNLHLDLWWRGENVLCDAGTFQYYTPDQPTAANYFKSTRAHNIMEVDGRDPLEAVTRFLWLPWPRAEKIVFQADGELCFRGRHYDYQRRPGAVVLRRTVMGLGDDCWVIADDCIGTGPHAVGLNWHLCDVPCHWDEQAGQLRLDMTQGPLYVAAGCDAKGMTVGLIRGAEGQAIQGWIAPYYAQRSPIPVLQLRCSGMLPVQMVTVISPERKVTVQYEGRRQGGRAWRIVRQGERPRQMIFDRND